MVNGSQAVFVERAGLPPAVDVCTSRDSWTNATIPEKEFREYSGLPTAIASTVPSSSAL